MLAFYREYPLVDFVPQAVAQSGAAPEMPQAEALFRHSYCKPYHGGTMPS